MIRHRLIVVICMALTTQVAMAAKLFPLLEQKEPRSGDSLALGSDSPATSFFVSDQIAATAQPMPLAPTAPPEELSSAAGLNCKRDFHPVCDCACHVPYLGCYGLDCACCTTDQWCPNPCECSHGNCYFSEKECRWVSNDAFCDVWGDPEDDWDTAARLGVWSVSTTGSLRKIGEYQDLNSSPFFDLDGIRSDGERTLDFTLSGLDNESSEVRLRYYGPHLSAKLKYERFPHRLDHDPLVGKDQTMPPLLPTDNVVVNDLNVGQDYAIRVQTLDVKFKGDLTDNVKWKLNLWGMHKEGERQANATAHCFNTLPVPNPPTNASNNVCHVLSQVQRIDWQTGEITPGIEAKFENVTVDYTRTWRGFGTDDQSVFRTYNHFTGFTGPAPPSNSNTAPIEYGIVPESLTQLDKVKVGWNVDEHNKVYANLLYGDTDSYLRNLHRWFDNVDLRWMNRSIDGVTLTLYGNFYDENNSQPTVMSAPLYPAETAASLGHPIDHTVSRGGLKGNWRPLPDEGLALAGGYEYELHERNFATYIIADGAATYTQPDTRTHKIDFGPEMTWSCENKSYVRYRGLFVDNPLVGVRESDIRLHTNLPEEEHRIELGHTWTPTTNFMLSAQVSLVERMNNSLYFNEQDYPFYITAWYAPTERLSFSGGYNYFSNAISQDISLGYKYNVAAQTETSRWDYAGYANVLSLSGTYMLNQCWKLTGGYEYMRGSNSFNVAPSPSGADWSLLPSLSDVIVETNRWTAGVDYEPTARTDVYFRYIYYGYRDIGAGLDSGIANMFLAGASVMW